MPSCFKCRTFVSNIPGLKVHFDSKHKKDCLLFYTCVEQNCFSNFNTWAKLRRHLSRCHRPVPTVSEFMLHETELNDSASDIENVFVDLSCDANEQSAPDPVLVAKEVEEEMRDLLIEITGKLYADPTLPRCQVQVVVDELHKLTSKVISIVKPTIVTTMQSEKIEHEKIRKVADMFDVIDRSFDSFSSDYLRLKMFSEQGCLLLPVPHTIGYGMRDKKKNGIMVKEIVPMQGQFIPLRKLFKMFLSLPGVFNTCYSYMEKLEKETNVLANFVQGKLWKEKKALHFKDKIVFPLFVYYDDLEVNDPLGSHKVVSKLGGTYVTIPCLPPEYQSKLENIFLALLIYSLDRSLFGNANVFKILVDEINYLQKTGIEIDVDGSPIRVYFALGLVLGDNLALNGVLGFVESFRAYYFCRFCKTHRDTTTTDCCETPELRRNVDDYERDVAAPMSKSGVKEKSIWNDVEHFHVYENFCSDPVLHEFAEGSGKRAMILILQNLFSDNTNNITLECVNERMNTFDFDLNGISNRPPPISPKEFEEKGKIYMSGSEMINFILIFSFLVGDLVPEGNAVWPLYLVMREILDIVRSTAHPPGTINRLKYLITEFLKLYSTLFDELFKAKEHIMTHWPFLLEMSGPLSLFSSMRMESKNRLFKLRAVATSSRVNIVFTTALKEQLQFCYRISSNRGLECKPETGPATYLKAVNDDCFALAAGNSSCGISSSILDTCVEVSWAKVKGTTYKRGMCVAMGLDEYDLPIFGDIEKFFCSEGNVVYLFCRTLLTGAFDDIINGYEVYDTDEFVFIQQENLLSFRPVLHTFMSSKEMRYACMKHT
ncbi:uncharacterized protein LOC117653268 [Thrips palmi]|uniref:Uncharacterized protein LOC117653268 n=1 Tax=Thrips palmi TaxID=161013 RepID=A0A6P9ABG1_THRPL|nr:uncharacterized protein LOC117653268 [Thrips palmi]